MNNQRFSRPVVRLADRAGQLFTTGLILMVTAPLWLLWIALILVLNMARPLIVYPLGFAVFGGLFAGLWFAYYRFWTDAAQAGLVILISGGLLMLYGAFFDRFKSDERGRPFYRPWWD